VREVACIAYADLCRLFRADGSLIPVHELGEDIRAAVASYETEGGRTKIKFWNKIDALDKAMRHLALFELDNRQQGKNLAIQINLVDAKR